MLRFRVAARTGGMSHGVVVFAITNEGRHACAADGYPAVVFRGGIVTKQPSGQLTIGRQRTVPTQVRRGDVWSCPDAGPRGITLQPGRSAYFALGTFTGAGGPITMFTSTRLTFPGATSAVVLHLDVTNSGQPIQVDVTALQGRPWPWM